jgi:hypothetical protein
MEFVFKLILIVIIWGAALILTRTILTIQIDPIQTAKNFIPKVELPEKIATRDSNKLYQNGEPVAEVIGDIREDDKTVTFSKLSNTQNLKYNEIFEFKRQKLRMDQTNTNFSVQENITIWDNNGPKATVLNNVLNDVLCHKVK